MSVNHLHMDVQHIQESPDGYFSFRCEKSTKASRRDALRDLVALAHPSIEPAPCAGASLNTGAAVIGFHHCTVRPRTNLASF